MKKWQFTSESVCSGHPDKICDQISDAIVDAVLRTTPNGRAAIETLVTTNTIILAGEVRTDTAIDYSAIARKEIERLGYTDPSSDFSSQSTITSLIHEQSPEIAQGVDKKGAGDQGMMFGFACTQTPSYMPLPITLAHELAEEIDRTRETLLPYLRPDGKTQVTLSYEDNTPKRIDKIVMAVPHAPSVTLNEVSHDLYKHVIVPVLNGYGLSCTFKNVIINGTGVWHHGGPGSDTGVTGRKIVVDTYGGYARVGGGCFSGKDPTKVDRSGAYAARFLAKNIVAHKLADMCEVRLAYCIGLPKPLMESIETFGTEHTSAKAIKDFANALLDTSVEGIITTLNLQRPLYHKTAAYGHFGRDGFPWEEIKT